MPGKFTKILIKGEKHPSFSFGPCQYIFVLASGRHGANPNYVVSGRLERGHGITEEILVSKKAHLTQRSDSPSNLGAPFEVARQDLASQAWLAWLPIGLGDGILVEHHQGGHSGSYRSGKVGGGDPLAHPT